MPSLLVRAAWICPIATPPLADGWVLVRDGLIEAVGRGHDAPAADEIADLGPAAVVPGLVNAHTHLELSWLRGRVPPAADFLTWVAGMMRLRTRLEQDTDVDVMRAIDDAVVEMQRTGTVAVGDVSNALVTPPALRARSMPAVVFHELIGFRVFDGAAVVEDSRRRGRALDGGGVRVVPAAHAPFSVSAELFAAVRDDRAATGRPTSIHVGESPEEVQLLRDGSGPWRERLQALGVWREGWVPPGRGPGDYLCDLGVLTDGALAVHGVQLTDAELRRLADAGVTVVTCPRSNVWVGVGPPPIARFFASGVRVAVGTDSLASAPDLNLFGELAAMRAAAPEVPARALLRAATLGGAEALGLDAQFGALQPGRTAHLVAVTPPAGTSDPEEAVVRSAGAGVRVLRITEHGVPVS